MRGGFPRSFTANSHVQSLAWRRNFARTFFEHDARSFGIQIEPQALLRFWRMLAHHHGQVWNAAEFARSFDVAESTMRRYLDVLECYFWALHSGAELDLLVERGGQRVGFEFKYTASPTFTASMRSSVDALRLDRLVVVHPGQHRFTLGDRARAVPLVDLAAELTEHGVIARDPVIA